MGEASDVTSPPVVPAVSFDDMIWRRLPCPRAEVRLDLVLRCGQSFRWAPAGDPEKEGEWIGVMSGRVWNLAQDDDHLLFKCFPSSGEEDEQVLRDYFQLHVRLAPLYEKWAEVDSTFKEISKHFPGVRILRQDPVENLFSFICSSNNNITRISSMVESLCTHYGKPICSVEKVASPSSLFRTFPSVDSLAADSGSLEKKLRSLGFGYRAAYIAGAATALERKGGEKYLEALRDLDYEKGREELLLLTGVGPKVADCVLLMSLDKSSAIPVDTHMFQIASNKYLPHLKRQKTVTEKAYREVAQHFRNLYGDYAGWAHSVLFSSDLKHLQQQEKSSNKRVSKIGGLATPPGIRKRFRTK